jgi:hypothetical protein
MAEVDVQVPNDVQKVEDPAKVRAELLAACAVGGF